MEEQKDKEVKMNVSKGEGKQDSNPPKYTYDQLNDICGKLFSENNYLKQQLQQADKYIQTFNRLDYLFKVVEISSKENPTSEYACFAKSFVEDCIAEIQAIMTPPNEEETAKEN